MSRPGALGGIGEAVVGYERMWPLQTNALSCWWSLRAVHPPFLPPLPGFLIFLWYWTMVLQAKKSSDFHGSSDSVKLQPNSSQSHPG